MAGVNKTTSRETAAGKKLSKVIKRMKLGPGVKVGVLQNKFSESKEGDEDETVGEIAVKNHFGTDEIPPRPFLTLAAEKHRDKWLKLTDKLRDDVMSLKMSETQALERLGLVMRSDVQNMIRDLRSPPNSEATIELKGSSNPLVDTGQMKAAIDFQVEAKRLFSQ